MTGQSSLERELAIEQAHVDLVLTHLRRATASAKSLVAESRARFLSDRETWLREEDGTALFERDAFAFIAARRLATLDGEHEGLVFGRLDLLAGPGTVAKDPRYIGRLGVRTPEYEPLVIDWRAAAAEPFYRATPVHPMDVVRRRVLSSRDDRVVALEDDVLMPDAVPDGMTVIGDGALIRALGRARDKQMHDIVATIQAEQDEVIRAPYQGFTLITGGPGTGKTVVGLHRIAFLLYTHRRRFTNGGVLVIGPSPVFMDYIQRVLPALGEDAVTLKALGEVASDVLNLTATRRDSDAASTVKGSLAMVPVLRALVEHPLAEVRRLIVMAQGEPVVLAPADLAAIRHDVLARAPYNEARGLAEAAIVARLVAQAERQGLTDTAEVADLIRDSWAFTSLMDAWWPPLEPPAVLARLADPALAGALGLPPADAATLSAAIDPQHWTVSDIPLLDELAALLGPVPAAPDQDEPIFVNSGMDEIVTISDRLTDTQQVESGTVHATYAHILVDEAQDITPLQWRMIHRRGANASWTIVGDPAQSSWPHPAEPARALRDLIGTREQRAFTLTTNYRSPKEASDLAAAYIRRAEPTADIPRAVRSSGHLPRLLVAAAADVPAVVRREARRLLGDLEGTIGVIGLPASLELVAGLGDESRLLLLDPLAAKGLEFDGVVVVDPDGIAASAASGARLLYVALTRPTQTLVTIDVAAPGRWRARLDPALYATV